jgi:hypothetical protein
MKIICVRKVSMPVHPSSKILSNASGLGVIIRVNFIQYIKLVNIENWKHTINKMKNPNLLFEEMDFFRLFKGKKSSNERKDQNMAD